MVIVTEKLEQGGYNYLGDPKEAWTGPLFNRPFPRLLNSHVQTEAKCKTFLVRMSFNICIRIKNHFHTVEPLHLGDRRKWPL